MVKTIYHDYIAKMSINKASAVEQSFVDEINNHVKSSNEKLTIENLFSANKAESSELADLDEDIYDPNEELSEETLAEIDQIINQTKKLSSIRKASEFDDPNKTESDISTLTDFSPPKDWIE